jgi:hypothetical protein
MPDRQRKARFARAAVVVLLLGVLLNATAHAFTHLSDLGASPHHTLSSEQGGPQSAPSLLGNNHCLTCQTLQHPRLNPPVPLIQSIPAADILIGWQKPSFSIYNPARAISNRAPPRV